MSQTVPSTSSILGQLQQDASRPLPTGSQEVGQSLECLGELSLYNQWVLDQFRSYLRGRVLEIGSGTGNLTSLISEIASHVTAVEPVSEFANTCRARLADRENVTIAQAYLDQLATPLPGKYHDVAVSCNVVEHIDDHVQALATMRNQVRPGGHVIALVPAGQFAMGQLDISLGHYRRYSIASIRDAMEQAGLEWVTGHYSNRIGVLGWWVNSVLLKKRLVPAGQARLVNRLTPLFRLADRLLPLPFGQSVTGIARRPLRGGMAKPTSQAA